MARITFLGYSLAVYEQYTAAGSNFDGLSPTNEDTDGHADAGTFSNGRFSVPEDTVNQRAGLFLSGHVKPVDITQMKILVDSGCTGWEIYVWRSASDRDLIFSDVTTGLVWLREGVDELPQLMPGENIQIVTQGTPVAAMRAQVYGRVNDGARV